MDRRKYLKVIGVGTVTAGIMLEACKQEEKTPETTSAPADDVLEAGREQFEIQRDRRLLTEKFFDEHEMATIALLADIIIPKDEVSGSATEAGVPEFIEFIVKDMPEHQLPLRGGLKWLDSACLNRFEKSFSDCTKEQQLEMVNEIAWPFKAKPEMQPGVAFFNRMRDLTATGFFTTEMGLNDLGYAGNRPGKWEGVPEDELEKFGLKDV
jgi:hypothetical protein